MHMPGQTSADSVCTAQNKTKYKSLTSSYSNVQGHLLSSKEGNVFIYELGRKVVSMKVIGCLYIGC